MLRTQKLTKRFGGLTAVEEVDFELGDELCSLIGPNGAGKTTFFDLLTGVLRPSNGTIELQIEGDWHDLTEARPNETASLGLHRSYQITNIFSGNTVLENVRIAAQAHGDDSFALWRNARSFDRYVEESHTILERVGLGGKAEAVAANLSHGEKRQLEVAIALAGDPDVLLLDEPNAGVSSESVEEIIALIDDVADDHAVLLVEHNMDIVMNVSDRVVVLHQGAIIADGSPETVRNDPTVQEAYLGGYAGDSGTTTKAESNTDTDIDTDTETGAGTGGDVA